VRRKKEMCHVARSVEACGGGCASVGLALVLLGGSPVAAARGPSPQPWHPSVFRPRQQVVYRERPGPRRPEETARRGSRQVLGRGCVLSPIARRPKAATGVMYSCYRTTRPLASPQLIPPRATRSCKAEQAMLACCAAMAFYCSRPKHL